MKKVMVLGICAGIGPLFLWICCEALDIPVSAGELAVYFGVVFVVAYALDFLVRRLPNIWTSSAAGATATVIVCWTGLEIVEAHPGTGPYIVLFISAFLASYLSSRWKKQFPREA